MESSSSSQVAKVQRRSSGSSTGNCSENNGSACHTFIIKRYKGKGVTGGCRYSFEPRSPKNPFTGDDAPEILWAQERQGKNKMYVISSNASDLTKSRNERSPQFLGKLDVVESSKVYVGYKQTPTDKEDKEPVVAVVYDHERASTNDRKMEIAVPLISFAKENIAVVSQSGSSKANSPDALLRLFMKVRREGQENHLERDKLLVLTQFDDSAEAMSSEAILSGQLKDVATCVSSKNFALVAKQSTREWDTSSHFAGATAAPNTDAKATDLSASPSAGPSIFVCEQTHAAADALPLDFSNTSCTSFMQFGKRNSDAYFCKVSCAQITPLMAFMIILSRFDTVQKF